MNVSKIKSFFTSNKKSLFYAGFFLFSFFLCSDLVFAVEPKTAETKAIEWINFILVISAALLGAITSLISMFLTPEWVNGTIFGLDKYMRDIWILVSNLVYFIFAFILIVIAFMNIIGNNGDTWQLKSALPKFIVWVIMVPFTWFFVQFILSLSAILTVAVITLPYDSFNWDTEYNKAMAYGSTLISDQKNQAALDTYNEWKKDIPTTYILDLWQEIWSNSQNATTETEWDKKEGFIYEWDKKSMSDILKWDNRPGYENSVFGVLSLYTYGVMKIWALDTSNSGSVLGAVKTLWDLTLKLIFDAVLIIVYLILMVALFLALLVRGIKLWIYAMFSPAFWLLYFFGKNDWVWEWNGKFGIKDFISLALVPVYVAWALSFGFLFLMVSSYGMHDWGFLKPCSSFETIKENKDHEAIQQAECIWVGGFVFGIKWSIGDANSGSDLSGSFGRLIMQLFGIVILWIAVMTALKQSEITNKITEPIQQFGWSVWSLIAKSPMYAPIIPGWLSAAGLQKVWTMPRAALETRVSDRVSPMQWKINTLFWADSVSIATQTKLRTAWEQWGIESVPELEMSQREIKGLIDKHGTDNSTVRELMREFAQELKKWWATQSMWVTDQHIENLFKWGKLSDAWYGMLFNNNSKSVTAVNGWTAAAYANGSMRPGGWTWEKKKKDEETKDEASKTTPKSVPTTSNITLNGSEVSINILKDDWKVTNHAAIATAIKPHISDTDLDKQLKGIGLSADDIKKIREQASKTDDE